jgi:hypothetical protein
MKKIFVSSIAVLAIVGFAVKKFRKLVVGGIVAVTIAAFAMFNVGLNSQSNLSKIALANLEALTTEYGGVSTITGECIVQLLILDTWKCQYKCTGCGIVWYASPIVLKAAAHNLTGKCSCGVTAASLPY